MASENFEQREETQRRFKSLVTALETYLDEQLSHVSNIKSLEDPQLQQLARQYNYYFGVNRWADGEKESKYGPLS